jgi:glutathione S-transferase
MAFEYLAVEDAIHRPGLRMVVVGIVPSPWGEAAKGFFHIKRIPWSAVRLVYDNEALKNWAGQLSGPVAVFDNEVPLSGWAQILMLAERLAPEPQLLPDVPADRARVVALGDKFCGERGLGWTRRLQLVHAGLQKTGGFPERVAGYLGKKYGYEADAADGYGRRVSELLGELGAELRAQRQAGGSYYLGETLTAADVYSATFMALLKPLPQGVCNMHPGSRAAFEWLDAETAAALDPILIEHRDMMYSRHLELPLSL